MDVQLQEIPPGSSRVGARLFMHRHRYVLGGTRIILNKNACPTDEECVTHPEVGGFGCSRCGRPHPLLAIGQEGQCRRRRASTPAGPPGQRKRADPPTDETRTVNCPLILENTQTGRITQRSRPETGNRTPGGGPQRVLAVAIARARCSTRASPSIPRRRRSSPAIGTRFCGARESLYDDEANRGSVADDRSASSTASAGVRSGEHSMRTMPDHGAPEAPGSRRYHDQPPQTVPRWKTGVRWVGRRDVTTGVSAAGRYCFCWVFT